MGTEWSPGGEEWRRFHEGVENGITDELSRREYKMKKEIRSSRFTAARQALERRLPGLHEKRLGRRERYREARDRVKGASVGLDPLFLWVADRLGAWQKLSEAPKVVLMQALAKEKARCREEAREQAEVRRREAREHLERKLQDMFMRKRCEMDREEAVEELKGTARIQEWLAKTKVEMRCLLRTRVSKEEQGRLRGEVEEGWSAEVKRPWREVGVFLDGERGWKESICEKEGKRQKKVPIEWQSRKQHKSERVSRPRQRRMDEKRKEELETKWWKFPSPRPPQEEGTDEGRGRRR